MKKYIKNTVVLVFGIMTMLGAWIPLSDASAFCEDFNPCTDDIEIFDPNFGIQCYHFDSPYGSSCDDNIHCNGEDICNGDGQCIHRNLPDCTYLDTDCQTGVCDEARNSCAAENKSSATICDDGLHCTVNDHCEDGFCAAGAPLDCASEMGSDPGVCGQWYCNEDVDRCEIAPANEDQPCDDGSFCTVNGTCVSGQCMGEPRNCSAAGEGCTYGSCDEENDVCITGDNKPQGAACDDGLFCTVNETCDGYGHCGDGLPKNCSNFASVCATAFCNEEANQCEAVPKPPGTYCDDGLFCTINTTCNETGECTGQARDCSGIGSTCAPGTCIENPPSCVPVPQLEGTPCDDGKICTLVDTCDGNGACLGTGDNLCDDSIDCTSDYCDPVANQCINQPNPCNDGNTCTNGDICNAETGACTGTPLPNGVSCVPVGGGTGICQDGFCHQGCASDNDCDDGIPCTIEGCNAATHTCEVIPEHGICNDHVFCNGQEICDPIEGCIDGPDPACDDSVSCTQDYCDSGTDSCKHLARNELCADEFWCNGDEICDETLGCQEATAARNCDDELDCTMDSCDDVQRRCVHEPDDMLCDDGQFCNGDEWCSPIAGCREGAPVDCSDNQLCTVDSCDEENNECLHEADDTLCDDGNFCNGDEYCDPLIGCSSHGLRECDDGIDCTQDSCEGATDSCMHVAVDTLCDDGSFCNGSEYCSPEFGCQNGEAVDCTDEHDCTVDSCNDETDLCTHSPIDAICDDNRFCTGEEACDPQHGCHSISTPDCDDGFDCTTDFCNASTDECSHLTDDNVCRDDNTCTNDTCQVDEGCVYQPVVNTLPCTITEENDGLCWDGQCVAEIPDGDMDSADDEDEGEDELADTEDTETEIDTTLPCLNDSDCNDDLVCDTLLGQCVEAAVADACEGCVSDRGCIHYDDGARCVPWTSDGSGVCGINCQTVPYDPNCPQNWRCFEITPLNGGETVTQCLPIFDEGDCSMPPDGDEDMEPEAETDIIEDGDTEEELVDTADPEPEPDPEPEAEPDPDPDTAADGDSADPEIDIPDSDPDMPDTDPDMVDMDPDDPIRPDTDETVDTAPDDTIGGGCSGGIGGSLMLLLGLLGLVSRRRRRH